MHYQALLKLTIHVKFKNQSPNIYIVINAGTITIFTKKICV
jgi:hypothetical protein